MGLHSIPTYSTKTLSGMCNVASSHTWSDVRSGLGSRVTDDSLPLVLAGLSSPSAVGSRDCSVQWGDGRLDSGFGVVLVQSSSMRQMVNAVLLFTSTYTMKAAKFSRGLFHLEECLGPESTFCMPNPKKIKCGPPRNDVPSRHRS